MLPPEQKLRALAGSFGRGAETVRGFHRRSQPHGVVVVPVPRVDADLVDRALYPVTPGDGSVVMELHQRASHPVAIGKPRGPVGLYLELHRKARRVYEPREPPPNRRVFADGGGGIGRLHCRVEPLLRGVGG